MKSLSYKALYWLFEITFYLFVLTFAVIASTEIVKLIRDDVPDHYSFSSIDPELVANYVPEKIKVNTKVEGISNGQMIINELQLTFDSTSLSTKLSLFSLALFRFTYSFVILWLLRKFIHSLKTNDTFTISNVKYLTFIGIMLLLIEPLYWVGRLIVRTWIENNFALDFIEKSTSFKIGFALGRGEFLSNGIARTGYCRSFQTRTADQRRKRFNGLTYGNYRKPGCDVGQKENAVQRTCRKDRPFTCQSFNPQNREGKSNSVLDTRSNL
jgi:hypothetical protein